MFKVTSISLNQEVKPTSIPEKQVSTFKSISLEQEVKPTSIPEKQVSTFKSISLEQIGLHLCQFIGTNWLYVGQ